MLLAGMNLPTVRIQVFWFLKHHAKDHQQQEQRTNLLEENKSRSDKQPGQPTQQGLSKDLETPRQRSGIWDHSKRARKRQRGPDWPTSPSIQPWYTEGLHGRWSVGGSAGSFSSRKTSGQLHTFFDMNLI